MAAPSKINSADALVDVAEPLNPGHHEKHFVTDHLRSNLGNRALSGGIITTISQGSRFGLYIALNMVLARMLVPEDFGLVQMALALTTILHMFRDAGLSTATIQQETITHAQVSNLFWANVGVGLLCTLVGFGFAPVLSWFNHDNRLIAITISLSLTLLAGGVAAQHLALLNRQMRFKALAVIDVGSMLISLAVGIGMAAFGCGYWSLVGVQLGAAFSELLMAWACSKWRPQLPKKGCGTRSMLHFGASITGAMLIRRITSNADNFLLGRYSGAYALGLYSRGMAFVLRPLDQFIAPFDKVFVPILSRLQDQPERYRRNFLQIYSALALLSFPIAGLLLGLSKPLVLVLLTKKWIEVAPLFAALSLTALYYPLACASMWLLTTQRRNRDILISGGAISLITLVSVIVGLPFGPMGVALALSLMGIFVRLPVQYKIVGRCGPVRTTDLWKVFLQHLPFWIAVSGGAYLPQLLFPEMNPLIQTFLGASVGLSAALILAWSVPHYRREVIELLEFFKRFLARRRESALNENASQKSNPPAKAQV